MGSFSPCRPISSGLPLSVGLFGKVYCGSLCDLYLTESTFLYDPAAKACWKETSMPFMLPEQSIRSSCGMPYNGPRWLRVVDPAWSSKGSRGKSHSRLYEPGPKSEGVEAALSMRSGDPRVAPSLKDATHWSVSSPGFLLNLIGIRREFLLNVYTGILRLVPVRSKSPENLMTSLRPGCEVTADVIGLGFSLRCERCGSAEMVDASSLRCVRERLSKSFCCSSCGRDHK